MDHSDLASYRVADDI
uniref:Uncharacterized protein n=1 Tax=Anguilla anguilla TaxID=7936 RepID=A0A0E9RJB0_ANGAN